MSFKAGIPDPWSMDQHQSVACQDAGSMQKHALSGSRKKLSPWNQSLVLKRLRASALIYATEVLLQIKGYIKLFLAHKELLPDFQKAKKETLKNKGIIHHNLLINKYVSNAFTKLE